MVCLQRTLNVARLLWCCFVNLENSIYCQTKSSSIKRFSHIGLKQHEGELTISLIMTRANPECNSFCHKESVNA